MQAGSVTTLLANPVLLLKKLCEIEAAELVKEEFIEHNSVKYYGRVIAYIGGGVYVEVIDRLYSRAIELESPLSLPTLHYSSGRYVNSVSKSGTPLPQEMTQAQKEAVLGRIVATGWGEIGTQKVWVMCTPVASFASGSFPDSSLAAENYPSFSLGEGAFSFGHTIGPAPLPKDNTGQFSLRCLGLTAAFSSGGFSQYTVRPAGVWKRTESVAGPLLTSNPLEGLTDLYYGTAPFPSEQTFAINGPEYRGMSCHYSVEAGMTWPSLGVRPFGIYAGDLQTSRTFTYGHVIGCEAYAVQLPVVGYASIRVGCAVGENGELINASPWEGIPVLPKARCDSNGYLAFYTDAVGDFGGGVMCGRVDTSRGNKADGNYAYVLRNYIPSYSNIHNPVVGTSLAISGGEASAGKRMNIFTPNPPIATDSVSGGPVVSDAFLYDDAEIRGIALGALGSSTGLNIGYMGWLEGKRYRMLTSGLMVQW